jgi:putative nucleic acid modification protein with dual OB domain
MAYVKRIVCLANSYKPPSGRCLAGIELLDNGKHGPWLRPVSARESEEVSYSEYRYASGESPKLLDIIDVPLSKAAPHNHQIENHIIDAKSWWVKKGVFAWDALEQIRDRPDSIWINSDHTQAGVYDCMSSVKAATVHGSLLLIKRKDFVVEIGTNSWTGKRTYRGKFDYKGTHHSFSLTDPIARNAFSGKKEGDYPMSDVYLCLSLTEAFKEDGRCHKLVAAVIKNPPL